jgi:hypothetical protein
MFNPLIISFIVFLVVLAGAFVGWAARQRLPAHHRTDETKNLVSVSMAVVATLSALVLGLDLKCQHLVHCGRRSSDRVTSGNPPGGQEVALVGASNSAGQAAGVSRNLSRPGGERFPMRFARCFPGASL